MGRCEIIYCLDIKKIWLQIKKNGHTSILDSFRKNGVRWNQIKPEELSKYPVPRVAMWRHPMDRLESAYRYFQKHSPAIDIPNPKDTETFSDWIMKVCEMPDEARNVHIATQTSVVSYDKLPDIIIPWDFDLMAQEFGFKTIEQKNITEKYPLVWSGKALTAVDREFSSDLKVWFDVGGKAATTKFVYEY